MIKIGDYVRFICPKEHYSNDKLITGEVYQVEDVIDGGLTITLKDIPIGWIVGRFFELVEKPKPQEVIENFYVSNDLPVDRLILHKKEFAYANGKIYPIYNTEKIYMCMSCMGAFRYVMEDDKILATAYPMMSFDNDFKILDKSYIENYREIIKAYDEYN